MCYGLVDYSDNMCRLRFWILQELCGGMEWVLKHQTYLQLLLTRHKYVAQNEGPWIFLGVQRPPPRCGIHQRNQAHLEVLGPIQGDVLPLASISGLALDRGTTV